MSNDLKTPTLTVKETAELVEAAARIGSVSLSSGSQVSHATALMRAVLGVYLESFSVDITYTAITVSGKAKGAISPIATTKTVPEFSQKFFKISELENFVANVVKTKPSTEELSTELSKIENKPDPHTALVNYFAWGGVSAGVATTMSATPFSAVLSAICTLITITLVSKLSKLGLPAFFRQLFGGLLSTIPIATAYGLGSHLPFEVNPSQAVAAGIVALLAGMSLLSSMQDVLLDSPVTAVARLSTSLLNTGGMIAGVIITLQIAQKLGVTLPDLAVGTLNFTHLPGQVVAASVSACCAAIASQVRISILPYIGAVAASGFALSIVLNDFGLQRVPSAAIAAIFVGYSAYAMAKTLNTSVISVMLPSLVPLLPGLLLYRGMYKTLASSNSDGFELMLSALLVACALAAGSIMGSWLAEQTRKALWNVKPLASLFPYQKLLRDKKEVAPNSTSNISADDN